MKKEIDFYQELKKLQKDFVDALKYIGFEWKYFNTYEHPVYGKIDVSKYNHWPELLKHMFEAGQVKKMHEIQNALGL